MARPVTDTILGAIGDTPMVRIHRITKGIVAADVLAKIETFNPGNSIKDRMAVKMIEDAERAGKLKPGGTIIEGTSGNTGMGLAIAAVVKGYKCIFTTTDKQSKEKVDALKAFGAEVIVCPTDVDPEDPRSYYSVSSRLERDDAQRVEGESVRQPVELCRALRTDRSRDLGADRRARRSSGVWCRDGRHDLRHRQVPERAQPADQDLGHRHVRLGLQKIQRDRCLRQERDLSVRHGRHRRGLLAEERGFLDYRCVREGDGQGCGADDASDRAGRRHLRRELCGRGDGRPAAARRSLQGGRDRGRHLS